MSPLPGNATVDPSSKEADRRLAAARTFLAGLGLADAVVFDHIGVQTYSEVDYARLKAEYSNSGNFLSERLAGGRQISKLTMRREVPGRVEERPLLVEPFAPKPDQVDPRRPPRLWHVAFVLRDFARHLPSLERASVRVSARLTVGDKEVLFLVADDGEEVELASMPLG